MLSSFSLAIVAMYPKYSLSCEATFAQDHLKTMLLGGAVLTGVGLVTKNVPLIVAGVFAMVGGLALVGAQTLSCIKLPN